MFRLAVALDVSNRVNRVKNRFESIQHFDRTLPRKPTGFFAIFGKRRAAGSYFEHEISIATVIEFTQRLGNRQAAPVEPAQDAPFMLNPCETVLADPVCFFMPTTFLYDHQARRRHR